LDLVRDSFSLSAVSDLPLEAADTTGTVAVARFGRVTMLSPRALARGYPWQDTLAHEITHLVLSRATAERAPLWLQEGVAKRQETRWRAPRPFDRSPDPSLVAYRAERDGKAVGVDRLGPSIALLPSPEAAGVAFAEVTSFVDYWLGKNGDAALPALLRDLDGGADPDAALRAVSGLGLADWQVRWRHELAGRFAEPAESHALDTDGAGLGPRQMAVVQRLVELLFVHGFTAEARERGAPDLERAPRAAALVFLVARAALAANEGDWGLLVPPVSGVDSPHGGYLATLGHKEAVGDLVPAAEPGDPASISHPASSASRDPEPLFAQALALDPLLPEVACEGVPFHGRSQDGGTPLALPGDAARRRLCEHTRSLPVRGAE
jgi:hypothetical protein